MKASFFLIVIMSLIVSSCSFNSKDTKMVNNSNIEDSVSKYLILQRAVDECSTDGEKLFKNNCAVCHALTNGENGSGLSSFLKKLPSDSLISVINYVSNSKKTSIDFKHHLKDSLTRKQIMEVVLFAWKVNQYHK